MNCILVPTLALDISLLERLANSIDYPIRYKIVINNGNEFALDEWRIRHPDWRVVKTSFNLGVAASWNLAPGLFMNEDAWLIVNDDHAFVPGTLEQICKVSDANYRDVPIIYMNRNEGYSMFVWTRYGVNNFGRFDENFYPGYYEDWEMRLRFRLKGAKVAFVGDENFPMIHDKPRPGGLRYSALVQWTGVYNREYFIKKWGAITDRKDDVNAKTFPYPFNNPANKISYWEIDRDRRTELQLIWQKFLDTPNPSIYE